MPATDIDRPEPATAHRGELRGIMGWWRGVGLGFVLLALVLFSRDMDVLGYGALAVGWAILIYAIIIRSRQNRARIAKASVEGE